MKKLAITDPAQIEEIIRKCTFCSVGITDLQGNPYVIPMTSMEEMYNAIRRWFE